MAKLKKITKIPKRKNFGRNYRKLQIPNFTEERFFITLFAFGTTIATKLIIHYLINIFGYTFKICKNKEQQSP